MGATSSTSSPQRWLGAAAWAASLLVAAPAHADPLHTVWSCWLHEAQNLACVATRTPPPAIQHLPRAAARALGGRRRQLLYIPLHNVPFDNDFVAELAQSVLCGGQSSCVTRYRPELGQLVGQAPEDFVDANDPVLGGDAES